MPRKKEPQPLHINLAEIQKLLNGLETAEVIEVLRDAKGELVIISTEPELVYVSE